MLAGAIAQIAPALAAPLTGVAALPLAYVAWVAHTAAGLPDASPRVAVGGRGGVWGDRGADRSAPAPLIIVLPSRVTALERPDADVPTRLPHPTVTPHARIGERRAPAGARRQESGASRVETFEGDQATRRRSPVR
jgi:hypothetical protein